MWHEPFSECSLGLFSPPAGASPLGEMPSVDEVGITSAGAGEDPLSSIETSRESRTIPDALSTSGPLAEKHPAEWLRPKVSLLGTDSH